MILRSGSVLDEYGRPVPGAKVYVYDNATGSASALTTDGVTALTQPVLTDQFGLYSYYVNASYVREDTWFGGKLRFKEIVAVGNPGADLALRSDLALSSGSGLAGFLQAGTGAVARTVQSKLRDIASVADFPDHATADAAGFTALTVPAPITSTRANGAAVVSNLRGPAQVTTADGNKRGKWFANVTAAPSSFGAHNSIETAFNGDLSHSIFQVEHRVTGAATLGQPTSGYTYVPEAGPHYTYLYNSSGWNNGTADNGGRTAVCAYRVKLYQAGQGDIVGYNFSGIVTSVRSGATSFLANPAVVGFNGDLVAGVAGAYLNPREIVLHDGGFDAAAIGDVINLDRNVNTGGLGAWWCAYRVQSIGAVAIDSGLSVSGKVNVLVDASVSNLGTNKAAIALKTGDRIYGNATSSIGNFATSLGSDWIERTSNGWAIVMNGTTALLVHDGRLTFNPTAIPAFANDAAAATGGVGIGGLYRIGSAVQMRVS